MLPTISFLFYVAYTFLTLSQLLDLNFKADVILRLWSLISAPLRSPTLEKIIFIHSNLKKFIKDPMALNNCVYGIA